MHAWRKIAFACCQFTLHNLFGDLFSCRNCLVNCLASSLLVGLPLERDLRLKHQDLSLYSSTDFFRHLSMFTSISKQNQTRGGERKICFFIQVSLCYILKHLEDKKAFCSYLLHLVWHHSHFQTAQKNSAYASFFYTQFDKCWIENIRRNDRPNQVIKIRDAMLLDCIQAGGTICMHEEK